MFATSPTITTPIFATNITTPLVLGGTGTTQDLSLQTTSGVGATGADMHFLVGNNGATEAMTILNNGNVGIGTTGPASLLHVATSTTATGTTTFEQASADTDSYDLNFRKARGTVDSPGVITTGDELGVINFKGYGGATTGYVTGAAIKSFSTATIGDNQVPGVLSFWTGTDSTIPSVLTERMTLDGAGNVGIGTSLPIGGTWTRKLQMTNAGSVGISLKNTSSVARQWDIGNNSSVGDGVNDLDFFDATAAQHRLVIKGDSGFVGIGTITPLLKLEVAGSVRFTGTATSVLTGTIDPTASATVTGVSTLFTTQLVVGDRITVSGETRTVTAIASNTSLTVDTAFSDVAFDPSPDKLAAIFVARDSSNAVKIIVNDLGNVGIGVSPSDKLDVNGNINIPAGQYYKYGGVNMISAVTASNNYFFGLNAGNFTATGDSAIGIGLSALNALTSGRFNMAIGTNTLRSITTQSNNTAVGFNALGSATNTGHENTALGSGALSTNTSGADNTGLGYSALTALTTGSRNIGVGSFAGSSNSTGSDNIVIGYNIMGATGTNFNSNTIVGSGAGVGSGANVFNNNSIFGFQGGSTITTGSNNLLYGYKAGNNLTTGSNNIVIGYDIDSPTATNSNTMTIGNLIFATGLDGTGTTLSTGSVGIGIAAPTNILHVTGTPATGTHTARIANTLGGTTQNNGLLILAGNDTGVAASEMITFQRPDATVIGSISQNAAATVAYNTSSDKRIKENITPTSFGLSDLVKINVSDFTFTSDPNKEKMTGFIAQDLNSIFPQAVTGNGDNGTSPLKSGMTPWMIDYSKLTPLLVKSVQELNLNLEAVAGTITPLSDSATETFVTAFFNNIYAKIGTWLADAGNGIMNIFAKEINTKTLCVSDDTGLKTCITKSQLDVLLSNAGSAPAPTLEPAPEPEVTLPTEVGTPTEVGAEPAPEPEPTLEPTPEPETEPTPEVIEEPAPEVVSEPTPASEPLGSSTTGDAAPEPTPEEAPAQ